MDIVDAAIRSRIAGMSSDEAAAAVQSDADLLTQWASTPDSPDTAAYVQGVLFGMTMFADFDELTSGT
jgi:hypothetical protein